MKWYLIIVMLLFIGCRSHEKDYAKIIEEMVGNTISFPDSISTLNGVISELPLTDFTILAYYDSTGCTSCRMKLSKWNRFMQETDSIRNDATVTLLLLAVTNKSKHIELIAQQNEFHHIVAIERNNKFAENNHLPSDPEFQCFLLNRKHEILLIGNPLDNQALWKLYMTEITGAELDNDGWKTYTYDFGQIKPYQEVSHIFRLVNTSKSPIRLKDLVSSCDCTEGSISKRTISPNEVYEVEVSFKDSIQGDFSRSITAKFENFPDIIFEVTGTVR